MAERSRINPETLQIADVLKWRPWPPWDPVPWWLLDRVQLPDELLTQLAITQMEFERGVLELQMKASEQAMEILRRRQ